MRLTFKILKLFAIFIITVSILLVSASFFLQDKVAEIILKSLNDKISTKLDVGSFKLSFLKKFPKASLELRDVLVHSSNSFSTDAFSGINTDTLLAASVVSVDFSITDIMQGLYNIERVGASNGKMNFYTDSAGLVNYDVSVKTTDTISGDFTLDLERITLTDIKAYYDNRATKLILNGIVNEGKIKSRISGDIIDFTAVADMEINQFKLYNTSITKTIPADLDISLQSTKSGILIKKGVLGIDNYDFSLRGFISAENMLDLNISGQNIDLAKITNYLPDKYVKLVSGYSPSGILVVDSKIKGLLSRTINPHIEITCMLDNGHVIYGKSNLTINALSFSGNFSNGNRNRPETSSVSVKNLKAKLGSAEYTGSLALSNFDQPTAIVALKGRVFPAELKEFFDLQNISTSSGSVDMDLNFTTSLRHKEKYSFGDIIDIKPQADLVFNSLDIGFNKNKFLVSRINGNVSIADLIKTDNLQLTYKNQRLKIDGEFRNLPEWIDGRPVQLIANADVAFSRLIPEVFLKGLHSSDTSGANKTAIVFPDDLLLDINFKVDSLDYKTFSSSKIFGALNYKPGLLTIKALSMRSLNGMISGNGFVFQNGNKSVLARGSFDVQNIDVNKAFTTFHNFGQDFIKAENLRGILSGTLSLLLPMDSMFNANIKSLTAEGKFILINGSLIDFEPVKQLSDFIALSELEDINFDRLENDFFIKNNFLYLPQMDVKSSAADLSVNGKHSFDNDYEYHIKILLSEILSKKRKKNKGPVTEFGAVQDDGLGRTSLLLKITGKGEEVKVGYDIKAATNVVKNNIKSERQTLKTILNQEYGWYKKDSVPKQTPAEKKTRFKISWGETDSVKTLPAPPVDKKENPIKNLFKKK